MVNNRGQLMPILIVVGGILLLLVVGFIGAMFYAPLTNFLDEVEPIITDLGPVGDVNASTYGTLVYSPVDTIINSFSWLMGVLYIGGILGLLALAFVFRSSRSGLGIAFFFALAIFVILASILISNSYEDYYQGTDEMSDKLKDMVLMSWLIIYSPMILSVFIFIAGIILFSGDDGGSI